MKKVKQTGSYVCLHIGLNKSIQEMMIKNTNLWIYPGYDHDQSLKKYLDGKDIIKKIYSKKFISRVIYTIKRLYFEYFKYQ